MRSTVFGMFALAAIAGCSVAERSIGAPSSAGQNQSDMRTLQASALASGATVEASLIARSIALGLSEEPVRRSLIAAFDGSKFAEGKLLLKEFSQSQAGQLVLGHGTARGDVSFSRI